ncbi:hypothetical protein ACHAW6_006760 [Cyclotella cf. meneghiniana]
MKPLASNGDGTSLLWSTLSTALPPRTLVLLRNALPASSRKNGAECTQRWLDSSGPG